MVAQIRSEEAVRRGRYSLTIAALFVLVLFGASLPLPQRGVAVVPLVVAGVESVRELRRLRRQEAGPLPRMGPTVTLGFVTLLLLAAITQATLYSTQKAFEDCMAGANTQAAQAICGHERQQRILGNVIEF